MSIDSSILEQAAEDIATNLFSEATFIPVDGGGSYSVLARYKSTLQMQQEGNEATVTIDVPNIDLLSSELSRDIKKGDQVTIDSTTYTIQYKLKDNGYFKKCAVTED